VQPEKVQPEKVQPEELKTIGDFLLLSNKEFDTLETVESLLSFDLDEICENGRALMQKFSSENLSLFKGEVAKRYNARAEERARLAKEEVIRKVKETASSLVMEPKKLEEAPPKKTDEELARERGITLPKGMSWKEWVTNANKEVEAGKPWHQAFYPEHMKKPVYLTIPEMRGLAQRYLREFRTAMPMKEQNLIYELTEKGKDYYLTGTKENIYKFMSIYLLYRGYPALWVRRTTYDTVAFYLSNAEDHPAFNDTVSSILIVEHRESLPDNKLRETLNVDLITARQAAKQTTIFLCFDPFPCVKDFCTHIICGSWGKRNKRKSEDVL
jgi:hypothetical protein